MPVWLAFFLYFAPSLGADIVGFLPSSEVDAARFLDLTNGDASGMFSAFDNGRLSMCAQSVFLCHLYVLHGYIGHVGCLEDWGRRVPVGGPRGQAFCYT